MTKLVKKSKYEWGDDLASLRQQGGELAEKAETKLLADYLIDIRKQLEVNNIVKNIIISSKPAISAKAKLMDLLSFLNKPDAEDLFEQAIEIILNELDKFREEPSSLYLVSTETGQTMMPISEEHIFTPPDYVGEDGELHKSTPTVHPGISTAFAMALYGEAKTKRILKKADDPIAKQAYRHLSGPQQILDMARDRLSNLGIEVIEAPDQCTKTIEFGREQVEGIFQAPNICFHRAHMFASILAQKMINWGGRSETYYVGPIHNKHNSKQRWYEIEIGVKNESGEETTG